MPEHRQSSPAIADSALTPEQIARLRQLHAAATPGPWKRSETHDGAWGGWDVVTDEWLIALTPDDDDEQDPTPRANADLIAEARNALPALLDAIEHERGEVEFWIRLYATGARDWRGVCMELFRRVAAGASLADIVDLIGDCLDNQDASDDESIAAFIAAKATATGTSAPVTEGEDQ